MKIAIMQPYFFPYIGYFQLIYAADRFVCYDDVNFINKSWINRNKILVNGKELLFTVPLQKASQNRLIKDIQIVTATKWKNKLLKTIEYNYKEAPFFDLVLSMLRELFYSDVTNISELNYLSIQKVCSYLNIDTTLISGSTKYENSHLSGQYRIVDICNQENADHYINPIGGINLYDSSLFVKEKIKLSFLKPIEEPYSQFNQSFVPFLSIIDVMMFCNPDEIKNCLLNKYKLI